MKLAADPEILDLQLIILRAWWSQACTGLEFDAVTFDSQLVEAHAVSAELDLRRALNVLQCKPSHEHLADLRSLSKELQQRPRVAQVEPDRRAGFERLGKVDLALDNLDLAYPVAVTRSVVATLSAVLDPQSGAVEAEPPLTRVL